MKFRRVGGIVAALFASAAACTADLLPEPEPPGSADASAPATREPSATRSPQSSLDAATPSATPSGDTPRDGPPTLTPGAAGSGSPTVPPLVDEDDAGTTPPPNPTGLPLPIHRYDFADPSAIAVDRVGTAHARVAGGAQPAGGAVELDGIDDYVELPAGLISPLTSVTLLLWLRWDGGDCWQRAFDFSDVAVELAGVVLEERVTSSLYATLSRCPEETPTIGFVDDAGREHVMAAEPLGPPITLQIGAAFDAAAQRMRLIVNGVVVADQQSRARLGAIRDTQGFLGHSSFSSDPYLRGALLDFRIYDQALDADALSRVFAAGPDAL